MSAKSLAPPQMSTGSLTSPDQFKIVDPHTVTLTLDKPDRLALANLCVCYADHDQQQARQAARDRGRPLGDGVDEDEHRGERRLHRREPQARREHDPAAQREVDGRRGRQLPFFRRIIIQTVPEPATRANLIERGDADLAHRPGRQRHPGIEQVGQVEGGLDPADQRLHPHHDEHADGAVRQSEGAPGDRGGAALRRHVQGQRSSAAAASCMTRTWSGTPPDADFPQPMPNKTDPARPSSCWPRPAFRTASPPASPITAGQAADRRADGRAAEGGARQGRHPGGRSRRSRTPSSTRSRRTSKMPFFTDGATAWLPYTYYLLLSLLHPRPALEFLRLEEPGDGGADARRALPDRHRRNTTRTAQQMIELFAAETPLIMLWQPNQDAVMVKSRSTATPTSSTARPTSATFARV